MYIKAQTTNQSIFLNLKNSSLYIWCIYVTISFCRCLLQGDNLNLTTNLKNYCFYAMLIMSKCTPLYQKLDCDAKNEPPYLVTTLVLEWNNHFVWKDGECVHWWTTRSCNNEDWSPHCYLFKKMGVAQGLSLAPRKESHNSLGEKVGRIIIDLIFHWWKMWVRNFQNMSSLTHSKCG